MNRRRFLMTSLAGTLAAPLAAAGPQARTLPFIAYLVPSPPECKMTPIGQAFGQALSDSGYIPGENVRWERQCYQREESIPTLVAEIVRQADVIVVSGTRAAVAAKTATTTIPIVFTGVLDPVGSGLVETLAKPGGNVTGITNLQVELTHKRLELLREALPGMTHVVVLLDPAMESSPALWHEAEHAARAMRVGSRACTLDQARSSKRCSWDTPGPERRVCWWQAVARFGWSGRG